MNNEEAIYCLKQKCCEDCQFHYKCWMESGGTSLQEAIATAIAALEKQIPKKPIHNGDYHCPSCGRYIEKGHRCHHNDCGQAIDWSE